MVLLKRYNFNTSFLEVVSEFYDWHTALSSLRSKSISLSAQGFTLLHPSRTKLIAYNQSTRISYYLTPED